MKFSAIDRIVRQLRGSGADDEDGTPGSVARRGAARRGLGSGEAPPRVPPRGPLPSPLAPPAAPHPTRALLRWPGRRTTWATTASSTTPTTRRRRSTGWPARRASSSRAAVSQQAPNEQPNCAVADRGWSAVADRGWCAAVADCGPAAHRHLQVLQPHAGLLPLRSAALPPRRDALQHHPLDAPRRPEPRVHASAAEAQDGGKIVILSRVVALSVSLTPKVSLFQTSSTSARACSRAGCHPSTSTRSSASSRPGRKPHTTIADHVENTQPGMWRRCQLILR